MVTEDIDRLVLKAIDEGFVKHIVHIVNTVMTDWNENSQKRFEKGLENAVRARSAFLKSLGANHGDS